MTKARSVYTVHGGKDMRGGMDNEQEDQSDIEQPEAESSKAEPQTRFRRKSLRRQLHDIIDELGKASKSKTLKEAKKIDALLRQSEVLMKLQEMDKDEANQTLQDEHAALTAQHSADTEKIAALEAQNASLKTHKCEIVTRVTTDPEHLKIRAQRDTLGAALRFLAGVVTSKEQTAIRAIQQLPADAASLVCEAVGIKDREYRQYLQNYRSERDLLNVIEKAEVDDTPLLRFVRAALSVIHGTNVSGPRRRESVPIDPVTAAKYLTGTLKPVGDDF